jgi:hypothetical protein
LRVILAGSSLPRGQMWVVHGHDWDAEIIMALDSCWLRGISIWVKLRWVICWYIHSYSRKLGPRRSASPAERDDLPWPRYATTRLTGKKGVGSVAIIKVVHWAGWHRFLLINEIRTAGESYQLIQVGSVNAISMYETSSPTGSAR